MNLRTSSSDNSVATVQPQYLPQTSISSGQLYLSLQKKKKKHNKSQGVHLRMQHYAYILAQMYTILEYGQFFLYLNNGGILGTDLLLAN